HIRERLSVNLVSQRSRPPPSVPKTLLVSLSIRDELNRVSLEKPRKRFALSVSWFQDLLSADHPAARAYVPHGFQCSRKPFPYTTCARPPSQPHSKTS